jgi:hypothetical protein
MSNNKQQTSVDLFAERTFNLIELMKRKWVNQEEFLDGMLKARNEAKEIEKEHELNLIKFTKEIFELGKSHFSYAIITNEEILELYNETYGGNK